MAHTDIGYYPRLFKLLDRCSVEDRTVTPSVGGDRILSANPLRVYFALANNGTGAVFYRPIANPSGNLGYKIGPDSLHEWFLEYKLVLVTGEWFAYSPTGLEELYILELTYRG